MRAASIITQATSLTLRRAHRRNYDETGCTISTGCAPQRQRVRIVNPAERFFAARLLDGVQRSGGFESGEAKRSPLPRDSNLEKVYKNLRIPGQQRP
ncbi:hypothetical protein [Paenibacillus kribbensis]|uniref:hypothetical protein n=1 Tax=Paenibacillus kribbensis TaxID=172713 RepID=UPI0015BFA0DB|nr:hypothetical protein [Paenibacillus kribbensis]